MIYNMKFVSAFSRLQRIPTKLLKAMLLKFKRGLNFVFTVV